LSSEPNEPPKGAAFSSTSIDIKSNSSGIGKSSLIGRNGTYKEKLNN
jgi:hypothetical protein